MSSRSLLRVVLIVVGLMLFTSCSLAEPATIAGFTFQEQSQKLPQNKVEPICKALENAGYYMPYGPQLAWSFEITQAQWVLSRSDDTQLTIPHGEPRLYIIVNWHIPADFDTNGPIVSQETVDHLAGDAKKICYIVQQEAMNQGVGPVAVFIQLWDLVVGTQIEYGPSNPGRPEGTLYTSHCDQLIGGFSARLSGLNPSGPVPGHCPSLYVSTDGLSHVRLEIGSKRDERTAQR